MLDGTLYFPFFIRVLNAQNELALVFSGQKPRIKSGSYPADVHKARRARRKSCDNFFCHEFILAQKYNPLNPLYQGGF